MVKISIHDDIKGFVYEYSGPICEAFIDHGRNNFILKGCSLIMSYMLKSDNRNN
jgi:hypothetical protein